MTRGSITTLSRADKALPPAVSRTVYRPGTAFGPSGEGHVRCSYATGMDQLQIAVERIAARPGTGVREAEPSHRFKPSLALLGAGLGVRADRHFRVFVLPHGLVIKPHFRRDSQFAHRDGGIDSQPGRRGPIGSSRAASSRIRFESMLKFPRSLRFDRLEAIADRQAQNSRSAGLHHAPIHLPLRTGVGGRCWRESHFQ